MLWQNSILEQRSLVWHGTLPRAIRQAACTPCTAVPDPSRPRATSEDTLLEGEHPTHEDNRLLIRRLKQSLAPKRPRDTAPLLRPKLASGATPLHNAEGWDSEDEEPPPTPSSAEPDTLRAARAMAHAPTISASRGGPAEQVARRAPRLVHKTVASGAARRQARSRTQLLSVGAEDGDSLDADEEVVAGAADAAQADVAAAHAQYAALLEDDDIIGLAATTPAASPASKAPSPGAAPPSLRSSEPRALPPSVEDADEDDYAVQAEIDALALELSDGDPRTEEPEEGGPASLEDIAAFLVQNTGMDPDNLLHAEAFSSSYQWLPVIGRNTQFVYKFLCTLGMESADIAHVLATNSDFLRRNTRSMVERLAYLQWVGIPPSMWALVVKRFPRLLLASVRGRLLPLTKVFVQELGMPLPQFRTLLISYPRVLAFNAARLRTLQTFLLKQGFSPEDVPFLLTRHPAILSAAPEQRLLRNLQWLAGKGMSEEEVCAAVRRFPGLLMYSTNTLEKKYTILTDYFGADIHAVLTFPTFFGYSLAKRILPRAAYLYSLGQPLPRGMQTYDALVAERDMEPGATLPPGANRINWNLLTLPDDRFAVHIAGTPSARYREFLASFDPEGDLPPPVPQRAVDEEMLQRSWAREERRNRAKAK